MTGGNGHWQMGEGKMALKSLLFTQIGSYGLDPDVAAPVREPHRPICAAGPCRMIRPTEESPCERSKCGQSCQSNNHFENKAHEMMKSQLSLIITTYRIGGGFLLSASGIHALDDLLEVVGQSPHLRIDVFGHLVPESKI